MLLAIDVGNTNIVLGVFDGPALVQSWRLQTLRERTSDELGLLVDGLFAHSRIERVQIRGVILGSVVPPLTGTIRAMVQRYFGVTAMVVEPGVNTLMPILYENPSEVGADRIVNAVAAYDEVKAGCIVVDFGTATTFDAVTPKGEYLGGAITPGIAISMEALFHRTSKLPRVAFERPPHVVGRNTVHSMQSGLVYGYVGAVDGICLRMKEELQFPVKVVATGGLAPLIGGVSKQIEIVDDQLTLDGLRIIWQRNEGERDRS